MVIKNAEFKCSNTNVDKLPAPLMPEYAFIGRSNVGKSSLINMLTGYKKLAKTSQTPGKTQLINHFLINEDWYIVDLPGYGFAKASKTDKASWQGFIRKYMESRENLQCVIVLIDSRHEPQKNDMEFIKWLGGKEIPFIIVFTKADKQSKLKTEQNVALFRKEMLKNWEETPPFFITSAETGAGREELLTFIDNVNQQFNKQPISSAD